MTFDEIKRNLTSENFISVNQASKTLKSNSGFGFYCIKIIDAAKLIQRYQVHLDSSKNRIIYIGKAETQTMYDRLIKQELLAKGHGTFFRSIGTALGYVSLQGTLPENGKNFVFSKTDTCEIVKWLIKNVKVNFIFLQNNFHFEIKLIGEIRPLLNYNNNPNKLKELQNDKRLQIKNARNKNSY